MAYSTRQVAIVAAGVALVLAGAYFASMALRGGPSLDGAACGGTLGDGSARVAGLAASERFVAWAEGARVRVHDFSTGETRALDGEEPLLAGSLLAYRAEGGALVEDLATRNATRLPDEATQGGEAVAFDGRWLVAKRSDAWSAWDTQRNATQRVPANGLLADGKYAYWNGGEVVVLDLDKGTTVTVALPRPPVDFDGATLVVQGDGGLAFARADGRPLQTLPLSGWTADGGARVDGDRVAFAGRQGGEGARWVVMRLDGSDLRAFGNAGTSYLGDVAGNRTAFADALGPSRVTWACLD